MIKNLIRLAVLLTVLISCNKNESSEFYVIHGEIKNYQGPIYLAPAVDTLYYSSLFKIDTSQVVNGKFNFKISSKLDSPLPFRILTDSAMGALFILEPKDHSLILDSINGTPTIERNDETITDQKKLLSERLKPLKEELTASMQKIYSSNYSNDTIIKYADIAQGKFKEEGLSIIEEFSKEYPGSYVSFWNLALAQMYYGYDTKIARGYENMSQDIKNSDVAKLFEEKLLMSKLAQEGTLFPTFQSDQ